MGRFLLIFTSFFLLSVPALAKDTGVISGEVRDPAGKLLINYPVRARLTGSESDARTFTDENGHYELSGLPEGYYQVSVNPLCCYDSFEAKGIAISSVSPVTLLIKLAPSSFLDPPSDAGPELSLEILRRRVLPPDRMPRRPDGKPDLSGLWLWRAPLFPDKPVLTAAASEMMAKRKANDFVNSPTAACLPSPAWIGFAQSVEINRFVQSDNILAILFEGAPGFRQVFLNGSAGAGGAAWMGHSVGHWRGDTLVVETTGFNARGWNWTYPRSEKMTMVEEHARISLSTIKTKLTITDPDMLQKPWVQEYSWELVPQEELLEYVCENNRYSVQKD